MSWIRDWWVVLLGIFLVLLFLSATVLHECNEWKARDKQIQMRQSKCGRACDPDNFRVEYYVSGRDLICLCYKKTKIVLVEKGYKWRIGFP